MLCLLKVLPLALIPAALALGVEVLQPEDTGLIANLAQEAPDLAAVTIIVSAFLWYLNKKDERESRGR